MFLFLALFYLSRVDTNVLFALFSQSAAFSLIMPIIYISFPIQPVYIFFHLLLPLMIFYGFIFLLDTWLSFSISSYQARLFSIIFFSNYFHTSQKSPIPVYQIYHTCISTFVLIKLNIVNVIANCTKISYENHQYLSYSKVNYQN